MPVPAPSRSGNNTDKKDPRLELADRLIAQIEAGTANWQRPWNPGDVLAPVSAVTGKPYRGVNYQNLLTFSPDPSDPRWCTYKQAQEQGWQVRKGEHGLSIEKWSEYEHKRTDEEIERLRAQGAQDIEPVEKRLGVRYYTVFHASQIDGIPPLERSPRPEIEGKPDERLSKLAENMGMDVIHAGGRAFYRPSEDRVFMPPIESFERATGHDTTLLHELSHATGHESRLKREIRNPFGSPKYAVEELRAEMSAAMTAASLGIGFDPASQDMEEGREMGNSAAYLASWLKALPENERKQAIMGAIKDAQGISDYLIERTPELQVEVAQERAGSTVSRGDYVRYKNEIGQELEGVVLDDAQPGEATRLRHITRWPNGTPLMEAADHIMPVVLPEVLDVHLVSAVRDGVALNGVDSRTNEYKLTMGSDMERRKMENRVLMDVERARGVYPTYSNLVIPAFDLKSMAGPKMDITVFADPAGHHLTGKVDLEDGDIRASGVLEFAATTTDTGQPAFIATQTIGDHKTEVVLRKVVGDDGASFFSGNLLSVKGDGTPALRTAMKMVPNEAMQKVLDAGQDSDPMLQVIKGHLGLDLWRGLDMDIVAFLEERNRVRQGAHPDFAGLTHV